MTTSLRSSRTRCGTTKTRGKAPCNNGRTIGMTTMSRMTSPCSSRRSSRRWTSECTVILKYCRTMLLARERDDKSFEMRKSFSCRFNPWMPRSSG
uniref:Uncharacterized protein n=1 Tax=Physcomitrium patens TaxID=3218 RepID=A0A7I4CJX6_PHYPA